MIPPSRKSSAGFSFIELMVVLVIITILVVTGSYFMSNRKNNAVLGVMDEIEGVIYQAQRNTVVSSRDVWLATNGNWIGGTMIMDPRSFNSAVAAPTGVAGFDAERIGSPGDCFRSHYPTMDHGLAGVDTSNWYTVALGTGASLAATAPISTQPNFVTALANPIFNGGNNYVVVNGLNKQFETGFYIAVVGLANGIPKVNGPIGLIVVPANGSSIYKFYRPDSTSSWRRR